jgi:hypothetical protein
MPSHDLSCGGCHLHRKTTHAVHVLDVDGEPPIPPERHISEAARSEALVNQAT